MAVPAHVLSQESGSDPRAAGRQALPRSLAAAIDDRLAGLPTDTRTILEMLSVLNLRIPLAQLGWAAEVAALLERLACRSGA